MENAEIINKLVNARMEDMNAPVNFPQNTDPDLPIVPLHYPLLGEAIKAVCDTFIELCFTPSFSPPGFRCRACNCGMKTKDEFIDDEYHTPNCTAVVAMLLRQKTTS